VAVCGKGFLHDVGDWLGGERVCVSHYMKDNVHERLEIHCPTCKTTCLLFENRVPIQPEKGFQVIWSPNGLRRGFNNSGLMNVCPWSCDPTYSEYVCGID